jgi:hypothetical protein
MKKIYKAIYMCALCAVACACSGSEKRDSKEVAEETVAAQALGRQQALMLDDENQIDSVEIQKILIDVRVRESQLRNEGEDELADSFIEAFLATLDSVNPSLHMLISQQ